jgi:hypothetical protein
MAAHLVSIVKGTWIEQMEGHRAGQMLGASPSIRLNDQMSAVLLLGPQRHDHPTTTTKFPLRKEIGTAATTGSAARR